MARASILWLIGEYCEHVPKIAPDVLRKMAKSFTNEEDIVKLQVINLAAKLYLTNSKQVPCDTAPWPASVSLAQRLALSMSLCAEQAADPVRAQLGQVRSKLRHP